MEILGSVLFALFTLMLRRRPGVALRDVAAIHCLDFPGATDLSQDQRCSDSLPPSRTFKVG